MHLKSLDKHLQNDEISGILVFQVQHRGIHEPIHPGTIQWSRQSLWMLRCCELQYVLGTPLAANQQLTISTERNATSLHCIENQCVSNERFTKVGTLLLWCGPAYRWATFLSPRPATTTTNSEFGSALSVPNTHAVKILYTNMILMLSKKNKNQQGQHCHKTATPTTPTVYFVIFVKCRVPWTAQCGADEKFTHILTTLGHCCLKESRRAAFWGSNPKMQRSSDSFALFICEVLFAQRIQMWSFEHPFRNLSCDQVNWSASSKRARCFDLWER